MLKVEPNMTLLTVQTVSLLEPRYLLLLLVGIHISYMTQPFFRYDTTLTVRFSIKKKICGDNKIRSLLRLLISGLDLFKGPLDGTFRYYMVCQTIPSYHMLSMLKDKNNMF